MLAHNLAGQSEKAGLWRNGEQRRVRFFHVPHRKRRALPVHLAYLWPRRSSCTCQSCSGRRGAEIWGGSVRSVRVPKTALWCTSHPTIITCTAATKYNVLAKNKELRSYCNCSLACNHWTIKQLRRHVWLRVGSVETMMLVLRCCLSKLVYTHRMFFQKPTSAMYRMPSTVCSAPLASKSQPPQCRCIWTAVYLPGRPFVITMVGGRSILTGSKDKEEIHIISKLCRIQGGVSSVATTFYRYWFQWSTTLHRPT